MLKKFYKNSPPTTENNSLSLLLELQEQMEKQLIKNFYIVYFPVNIIVITKGNLNNQIGVPLSILEINNTHEIAIIEMGASEIGEIEKLSNISQPNTGIITNVGTSTFRRFGNFKGVVKTKTELYNFIEKTNGTVFVNSEDRILLEKSNKIKRVRFGKGTTADFNAN